MIKGSLSKRYAKALIELAAEENIVDRIGEELNALANLLEEAPDVFQALRDPAVARERRRKIVETIIEHSQPHPLIRKFLLLVFDRRRIEYLPAMALSYRDLADERAGKIRAKLTSAMELDPSRVEQIKEALQEQAGKIVVLETGKDSDLIAGVVARVGNLRLDYSLRNQLRRVEKELIGE